MGNNRVAGLNSNRVLHQCNCSIRHVKSLVYPAPQVIAGESSCNCSQAA